MRGERGAVDWSVGKLLAIVLLVILLVIVTVGWKNITVPLLERAKGMFNDVLLLFGGKDGGDNGVNCLDESAVSIDGVGDGKITYCRGYCEIRMGNNYFELAGFKSSSFKYNVESGVMNVGGSQDDGKWYSFDQSFVGLNVDEINIVKQLYNSYKQAYEIYFDNHKKSKLDISLESRAELFIYVRIGANLYRWMEDLKSWEVCDLKVGDENVKDYCFWTEKGKWDVRVGDSWQLVENYGKGFDYLDTLMASWKSGSLFWYSTDFTNLIPEDKPTFAFMQDVRNKEIKKYEDSLNSEFKELLNYDLQGGKFSVDVMGSTSINSPIVVVNNEVKKQNSFVVLRMSGYLDNIGVNVIASGEKNEFVYAVKEMPDKELVDLIKVNKIYEFLKSKC